MSKSFQTPIAYEFGRFRLDVEEARLLRDGEPVPLRPKTFDTLLFLIRNRGRLVTKGALLRALWPDTIVDESNIPQNIFVLRQSLRVDGERDNPIETVSKRGYRFLAEVREIHADDDAHRAMSHPPRSLEQMESTATAYLQAGDVLKGAEIVLELSQLHWERRRFNLARGWLTHAEDLLSDQPQGPTHCMHAWMKSRCLSASGDLEAATAQAQVALELSRRLGARDAEALSLLELGHLHLARNRFEEAVSFLDRAGAAAMAGALGPQSTRLVFSEVVQIWWSRGNWRRAAEWTEAMLRWFDRGNAADVHGTHRLLLGEFRLLRGALDAAERDLEAACEELLAADVWYSGEAFRKLGDVRLRRGNLAGAERAFRRALELGIDPQPGLAKLRTVRGEERDALEELRHAVAANESTGVLERERRLRTLPILTSLSLAADDMVGARSAVEELDAAARDNGSSAYRASAACARGELSLAEDNAVDALAHLQEGWRIWCEIDAPYEAADVRVTMARALTHRGDLRGAKLELDVAAAVFARLGAELDRRRTEALRDEINAPCRR